MLDNDCARRLGVAARGLQSSSAWLFSSEEDGVSLLDRLDKSDEPSNRGTTDASAGGGWIPAYTSKLGNGSSIAILTDGAGVGKSGLRLCRGASKKW